MSRMLCTWPSGDMRFVTVKLIDPFTYLIRWREDRTWTTMYVNAAWISDIPDWMDDLQ